MQGFIVVQPWAIREVAPVCLPYWDSDLDVEVGRWGAVNLRKRPVSSAGFHSPLMAKIAAGALALESELLYLCGLTSGVAGTMAWENPLTRLGPSPLSLFTLVLGYSRPMEALVTSFLERHPELRGGVTDCTFWCDAVPSCRYKVIVVVAALPLVDEGACLRDLGEALEAQKPRSSAAFYAEKLGYLRGPVPYETDNPRGLSVTAELLNLQLEATWEVLGPSPVATLPALIDLSGALTPTD